MTFLQTLASLVLALTTTVAAGTQDAEKPKTPPAAPKAATAPVTMPVKVQVVIGRYQGDKKVSSMPYTLSLNAAPPNNFANLRMGAKIPVVLMMTTNLPKDAPTAGPVQYQDIGTNIDCRATPLDDGRFLLTIGIEDTSVYPDDQGSAKGNPSFRSFRASDTMTVRNGQTAQFTAATDKVNGEQTRVDVTLTVVR